MSDPTRLSPNFPVWLRDHLAQLQLSAPTLARRSHIPLTLILAWLSGEALPSREQANDLADALCVRVSVMSRILVDHETVIDSDE